MSTPRTIFLAAAGTVADLVDAIPDTASSLEQEVLPGWIPQSLHGFPTAAPFLDSRTPDVRGRAERVGEKQVGQAT